MKSNQIVAMIILLICTLVTSPLLAEDKWLNVYGKVNVAIELIDEENGDDQWEVNSHASRFGVKGKGSAGDGFEAFYQLEWEVDVTDKATDNIKSRNQIVGLRGGFGEVFIGRHDTPTKKLQKKIDIFGDLKGDIKNTFNAEKRSDDIVQYSTPKMSGFKLKAAFVAAEDSDNSDGTSIAAEYSYDNFDIGISLDEDIEKQGAETTRLVAQYRYEAWRFGLMLQNSDYNNVSDSGFMISAKYTFDKNTLKVQIVESDIWKVGISSKVKYASQISLGWDRKMGKHLTGYTYLTLGEEGATKDDDSIFGVGMSLKF